MKNTTLYITYDGLTDPLGKAQIIPYVNAISNHPRKIIILSFEKKQFLNQILITKKTLSPDRIKWIYLNFSNKFGPISKIIDFLKITYFSIYLTYKYKIEIVHGRGTLPSFFGYLLKKIFNIKLVFDCRGMWTDERADNNNWKIKNFFYRSVYKIFKRIEDALFINSDSIVVLTQKIRIYLITKYAIEKKITVIPCSVSYDLFKYQTNINRSSILKKEFGISKYKYIFYYSGSLGGIYQLDEMLNFFQSIYKSNNNHYFIFFTNNQEILNKTLLDKKYIDIKKNIKIKNIDRELLPKYISLCDMMIYFIKPTFSKTASCPTKLGESLSIGVPIITNKGIGDIEDFFLKMKPGYLINNTDRINYEKVIKNFKFIVDQKGDNLREKSRPLFDLKNAISLYEKVYSKLN